MSTSSSKASLAQRSWTLRFLRWLFNWRTLRAALLTLAVLATWVGLFYAEENWRGKRAWNKFRRQWEAKGERFDLASVVPKPVPPEQNFAMTPSLAPLFDYTYDRSRGVTWKDTNAVQQTERFSLSRGAQKGTREPSAGHIAKTGLTDLSEWVMFLRGNTNFPPASLSGTPAQAVLAALGKFDPVLEELRDASHRPHAVFPVHYEENFRALLPHLAQLKGLSQILRLRTVALLENAQPDLALRDVELNFHLAASVAPEPLLISQLVRLALLQISLQSVWEGLAKPRGESLPRPPWHRPRTEGPQPLVQPQWQPAQLERLQKLCASTDVLADYGRALRGERAMVNHMLDKIRRGEGPRLEELGGDGDWGSLDLLLLRGPQGWLYQNQLVLNQFYQERGLPLVDAEKHRVYVAGPRSTDADDGFRRGGGLQDAPELAKPTLFNYLARLLSPAMPRAAHKFALCQTMLDCATVACALERHRLAQGVYPDDLASLVPRLLEKIPSDVISGQPLKYRRTDDGRFVLYSVGWNQTDDGGQAALTKDGKGVNFDAGDWVWRYP